MQNEHDIDCGKTAMESHSRHEQCAQNVWQTKTGRIERDFIRCAHRNIESLYDFASQTAIIIIHENESYILNISKSQIDSIVLSACDKSILSCEDNL